MTSKLTWIGIGILLVGLLFIVGGGSADSTRTVETCYATDYGNGCIVTEYEAPTAGIAGTMIGFPLLFVGGVLAYAGHKSDSIHSTAGRANGTGERTAGTSFEEELQRRRE